MRHGIQRTRRSAFTLIELLVVVAIIALLLGLLLPALNKARRTAQIVACTSNVDNITIAILTYIAENDEIYPAGGKLNSLTSKWWELSRWNLIGDKGLDTGPSAANWKWRMLNPYIDNNFKVGMCPRDLGDPDNITFPGATLFELKGTSYYYWYRTETQLDGKLNSGRYGVWSISGHGENQIDVPTKKVVIADATFILSKYLDNVNASFWHNDRPPLEISVGFADGHARNVTRKDDYPGAGGGVDAAPWNSETDEGDSITDDDVRSMHPTRYH